MTQRKHLEQVALVTGKKLPELEQSNRPPEALLYLWVWYSEELQWNSPLNFQEIKAWSDLRLCSVTPFEAHVLFTLDKQYRISCLPK